jgi:hypothetical protein
MTLVVLILTQNEERVKFWLSSDVFYLLPLTNFIYLNLINFY